ncbi:hypothetical protein WISP_12241 [Willisornis vidua]|uniref:Uncharacterized protein n=1 Tax=Willisornis vidua TaxID=1566151 RepID=A0ABQ9DS80_9PASS|nr:hypothetical protein WISP_12241 [Willisornis vidua]
MFKVIASAFFLKMPTCHSGGQCNCKLSVPVEEREEERPQDKRVKSTDSSSFLQEDLLTGVTPYFTSVFERDGKASKMRRWGLVTDLEARMCRNVIQDASYTPLPIPQHRISAVGTGVVAGGIELLAHQN